MSLLISIVALVMALICLRVCRGIADHVIELQTRLDTLARMKMPTPKYPYEARVKGQKKPIVLENAVSLEDATRQLIKMGVGPRDIISLDKKKEAV